MAKGQERDDIPLSKFSVLVAQLQSIVVSASQKPPDPLLCFDLLSDLVAVIEDEPKDTIQYAQRKCEDALYSLLILGAKRPIRRLASLAMAKIIAKGDGISIYSRASSLQGFLSDGKRSDPLAYAGAAQCLGELYHFFGRRITSGLFETTTIVAKLMKYHEDFVRQEALKMLENALEGSAGSGAATAYSEAFRIIMRVGVGDKSVIVRLAAARCLKAFVNIGGPGLGVAELENCASHCVKALEDPIASIRDAFAEALGALLALSMNPGPQVQPKGKGHAVLTKKLEGSIQKHLIWPFMRVGGLRLKDIRIGLALSWVFFLQAMRLKYHVPDGDLQSFALQALDMLEGTSVDAHSLACVLYILRIGVADQMTEPIQRNFLVFLGKQLESSDLNPYKAVAALRTLSYLLTTLGEVPGEFKEVLDNTVIAALSHPSSFVRVEAALTVRALAEVDPTCVGGLISYGVTTLQALRESAAGEKGDNLKAQLDSLHGQAIVLAALVSISPQLLLGYPARLPKSVFIVSKKMLTEFTRNAISAAVEKEAGWLLLASLISSIPKKELEDQVFDIMSLWAGPFGGNPEAQIKEAANLASELRVWSAAVEAITAFIRSFVSPTMMASNGGIFLQPVLYYLSRALSYIPLLTKQSENLKSDMDQFIVKILVAYQSIPDPMAYKNEHSQILNICTSPFRDPSSSEESSRLMMLVDKRDACLGPRTPGRDWFEDELRAFEGGKDGLIPCVWVKELTSFPQPETISKKLINQMLTSFGTIFAVQNNGGKLKLLGMIEQCLKAGKKQPWHVANMTNICVGLLAGLKALLALRTPPMGVEILSSSQAIFLAILAEGSISAEQRRASAEGLGLIARLGDDVFTPRMTRSLLGDLLSVSDSAFIGSIAFALGCIHRSAGGIALSTMVPATVSALSSLAKSPNSSLQAWSLHGLLLTIEAAGLSYVSHVQATLLLAVDILLSEENGWVTLRQEVGRLINAIVAVLGPELSPGSTFFSRCKSVVAEISSGQETSTLLECVRFTQQLVLFAPQAVSMHSHIQTLLPTLSSKQPSLRHLAVSTLRHLIEKDPVPVINEQIEVHFFRMLDEETDSEIANLVRSTIKRLLYASCPTYPSRWIAICRDMVLAASTTNGAHGHVGLGEDTSNSNQEGDSRTYYGEDDEDMIASSSSGTKDEAAGISTFYPKREKYLRYRTRIFAAECLSHLPDAVGTNPAHFDLSLARTLTTNDHANVGDWLILHVQELVALAYQISTSQFEKMQPIGVGLLITIMDKFEKVPDPELPGQFLMEQYQAQFVSAVRTALNPSSSPLLLERGLQLASKILTSSITRGDRVALHRLFTLISRQLDEFKDLYYPSFAEWVVCKIKVRLLAAHASIKCYTYTFLRGQRKELPDEYLSLIPVFSKTSSILGSYWIQILYDYIYLCFGLQSKSDHKLFLDGLESPLVSSKVRPCLDESWLMILQAISLDAVPGNFEIEDASGSAAANLSKRIFISGYGMVRLELREFYFLWGFVLLVLFQQQQSALCEQVIPLGKVQSGSNSVVERPENSRMDANEIPLQVLQSLSEARFFGEFLSVDLCKELLQVLLYLDGTEGAWSRSTIALLLQVVQACPDNFFEVDDFMFLAMELCITFLDRTFLSDASSQDVQVFTDLTSILFVAAETIFHRLNPKKHAKLILAIISTSCICLKCACTETCLSSVNAFCQNIIVTLEKPFEVKGDISIIEVLGAWQSDLISLSHECIKSIHVTDTDKNSSEMSQLKLFYCIEQVVSLVQMVHKSRQYGSDRENSQSFFYALCRNSSRCLQVALADSNLQVQMVVVRVLKGIAQKELGEGSKKEACLFVMFLLGELCGDIFFLIQSLLKKDVSKESAALVSECLKLLLILQTLSVSNECLSGTVSLLLDAIVMVVSISNKRNTQELLEIKTTAMRLVSRLAQIPSSAIQLKEVLLAMPADQRQQLQDILRASVAHSQNPAPMIPRNFHTPTLKLPVQVEQPPQTSASTIANVKEESDEEDDWDTFQSFPAADTPAGSLHNEKSQAQSSSAGESPAVESSSPTDVEESPVDDQQMVDENGGNGRDDPQFYPEAQVNENGETSVPHDENGLRSMNQEMRGDSSDDSTKLSDPLFSGHALGLSDRQIPESDVEESSLRNTLGGTDNECDNSRGQEETTASNNDENDLKDISDATTEGGKRGDADGKGETATESSDHGVGLEAVG